MDKSNSVKRLDDQILDHYYSHLKANGLAPRKQGFDISPTIQGNKNILGEEARKHGMPHIVSGISLSEVFNQQSKNNSK
jgi:hypothetical protein